MSSTLEIVSRLPESNLVKNDDVVALIFLNGKLFTAINTRDNKGIIKVWTKDFQLLYEFVAHEYPIYHMIAGHTHNFFTSASDSSISHWVEKDGEGICEKVAVLLSPLLLEPAWRLSYDKEESRLYSGDSTGTVHIWENDELVGSVGTVVEIWDMFVGNGVLYTARNLDVYLTTLRNKRNGILSGVTIGQSATPFPKTVVTLFPQNLLVATSKNDGRIIWGIKNTVEGTGPLCVVHDKLCFQSRSGYHILVHCLKQTGNPRLASMSAHEANVRAIVEDADSNVIYTGGYDTKVIAWDLNSYEKLGEVKVNGYVTSLTRDSEKGIIYVGGEDRFLCAIKLLQNG